jgi:dipeptidase E
MINVKCLVVGISMKRLFLASYFADVVELFVRFYGEACAGKTVTFIPTASLVEEINFYVEDGKRALEKLGLIVDELEVSAATKQDIEGKLQKNDLIYVTGGNTFFLLQELKRTGADEVLTREINCGKIYIGESAGSMVMSPNIEYVKKLDDLTVAPGLGSFSSLGVVGIYPVPHYKSDPFKEPVDEIISAYGGEIDLCPISNAQAIIVMDNKFEVWSTDA